MRPDTKKRERKKKLNNIHFLLFSVSPSWSILQPPVNCSVLSERSTKQCVFSPNIWPPHSTLTWGLGILECGILNSATYFPTLFHNCAIIVLKGNVRLGIDINTLFVSHLEQWLYLIHALKVKKCHLSLTNNNKNMLHRFELVKVSLITIFHGLLENKKQNVMFTIRERSSTTVKGNLEGGNITSPWNRQEVNSNGVSRKTDGKCRFSVNVYLSHMATLWRRFIPSFTSYLNLVNNIKNH